MKPSSFITLIILLFCSCSNQSISENKSTEQFTSELKQLKEYFHIPGMAVSIDQNGQNIYQEYFGFSDFEKTTPVDSATQFPIASITKVFSGILIMKLVEQEQLSLAEPINSFLENPSLDDSIQVKHILSHTSQGNIGEDFYYSSRFGLLTQVIEKVSGQSFAEVLDEVILKPLQLKHTYLLKDSTQIENLAKPYFWDNKIEIGFIDYGYSSSAGLVSNLNDLRILNKALDDNTIISKASKDLMFSSYRDDLPYGFGIFNQQFEGLNIVWAYGQYDCYSSLLIRIPSQDITLTILANNSLLSDPARLIYGDVTSSLFAHSFLKNYIFDLTELPLFEIPDSLSNRTTPDNFLREKILAQALAESYMARFDPQKIYRSAELIEYVFSKYPNYLEYADLSLLHNLSFLKDVAFYMDLDEFNKFDIQLEKIAKMLLAQDENNPYVHSYLGTFYDRKGNKEKAKFHFDKIVNAQNFSKNWYTTEAENWLNENTK